MPGSMRFTLGVVVALVAAFHYLLPSITPRTLPFGVRTPPSHEEAPAIAAARRVYRAVGAATGAAALVAIGVAPGAAEPALVLVFAAVLGAHYAGVHLWLRARKERDGWYRGLAQAAVAETRIATEPEPFPWPWFALPAFAVLAATAVVGSLVYPHLPARVPIHFDAAGRANAFVPTTPMVVLRPLAMELGLTLLMALLAYAALRSRQDLDPAQVDVSVRRHVAYRRAMTGMIAVLGAAVNLTMGLAAAATWGLIGRHEPLLIILVAPVLLALAAVLALALRVGQEGSRIPNRSGGGARADVVHRDDDRYWKLGGIYVNRDDPALFVTRRFGIGMTVNLGHPVGWLIGALVAAVLVWSLLRGHPLRPR